MDKFEEALYIKQVKAMPLRIKDKEFYELGGGLFTKKQIIEARKRLAELKYGIKGL